MAGIELPTLSINLVDDIIAEVFEYSLLPEPYIHLRIGKDNTDDIYKWFRIKQSIITVNSYVLHTQKIDTQYGSNAWLFTASSSSMKFIFYAAFATYKHYAAIE